MAELYTLIGRFQDEFRGYLEKRLGSESLDDELKRTSEVAGSKKLELAAFKRLVLSNKSAFMDDFGRKANSLPTWLDDLLEIRNKIAHYDDVSADDRNEALRLIKKISEFAGLKLDTGSEEKPNRDAMTQSIWKSGDTVRDTELDGLLNDFPSLSLKRTKDEYRVYRNGIGRGSLWIAKQRGGYRIVTTGVTSGLKNQIEAITNRSALTMRDRDHLWWKHLTLNQIKSILYVLEHL